MLPRSPLPRLRHVVISQLVFVAMLVGVLTCTSQAADPPAIRISTPMPPPDWAVMQKELIRASTQACIEFHDKYFDKQGYLLCVERWGGDDGPDDAMENVGDWPILHALGADDVILDMYKHVWEGHLRQYTLAKTTEVPAARDGMYYKEFCVQFDWMHLGEGLRVFNLQGLSDPEDAAFARRVRRYAGFYMNEDEQAQNYDPQHKIIRSLFNGSRGPLLRKATALDWTGDPIEVAGRFRLVHGERSYDEMLAHFKEYTDVVGDHPQNMCATTLALNAYMLTGEAKYKNWLVEYVDAWADRAAKNNGILPSNIGLDGTIGGETGGKWYGGAYGWGFSPTVPQTGRVENRSRVERGIYGFGNALLLTGDQKYVRTWTKMIDSVNSNARQINGRLQYPRMHGDQGWYGWSPTPFNAGGLQCWFWTCDEVDAARVRDPWITYLRGEDATYPVASLQRDFETLRRRVASMRADETTPDTRLADDPMNSNPAIVNSLNQQMQAGLAPGLGGGPIHTRLRYFDPTRKRAGIPESVAALVHKFDKESIEVTLVNLSQLDAQDVVVQGGAYGEHVFASAKVGAREVAVNAPFFTVRLEPGSGARLTLKQNRYSAAPTLSFPWNRRAGAAE